MELVDHVESLLTQVSDRNLLVPLDLLFFQHRHFLRLVLAIGQSSLQLFNFEGGHFQVFIKVIAELPNVEKLLKFFAANQHLVSSGFFLVGGSV